MKKKRKKSPSYKSIKNKAWQAFSRYIRLRDANEMGNCTCISCGTINHWKEMQAGHFIDGRHNAVLFDDRLVYAQCVACNMFLKGNKVPYTLNMVRRFGVKQVDEWQSALSRGSSATVKLDRSWLLEKIEEWEASAEMKLKVIEEAKYDEPF